jgi:hypothetical protein
LVPISSGRIVKVSPGLWQRGGPSCPLLELRDLRSWTKSGRSRPGLVHDRSSRRPNKGQLGPAPFARARAKP